MPFAIHSFQIETDDQIRMCHVFYGATKHEAETQQKAHAAGCPHYGPALARGEVIDIVEELEALPEPDTRDLLDFLDLSEGADDEEDDDEGFK